MALALLVATALVLPYISLYRLISRGEDELEYRRPADYVAPLPRNVESALVRNAHEREDEDRWPEKVEHGVAHSETTPPTMSPHKSAPQINPPTGSGEKRAIFFYATNTNYFCMAAYNILALKRHWGLTDSNVDYVLGYNFPLPPPLRTTMSRGGLSDVILRDQTDIGRELGAKVSRYKYTRNKFDAFRMTQYDAVVFADSDAFVLRSFADLFVVPPDVSFAAPQTYYEPSNCFTSALFYVRPNEATYRALARRSRVDRITPDMDILIDHFMQRVEIERGGGGNDGGGGFMYYAKRMTLWPYYYFCVSYPGGGRPKSFGPHPVHNFTLPGSLCADSYVMHFSGEAKPWILSEEEKKQTSTMAPEVSAASEDAMNFVRQCRKDGRVKFDAKVYNRLRKDIVRIHRKHR